MKKGRLRYGLGSLAALFFCILTLTGTKVKAGDFPANPLDKEGYVLDFSEEFNGDSLDSTKWTDYYLPHWTSNPENAKANYRFENGCLVEYITKDQQAWSPEHDGTVKSSAIMSFDKSWIHNFSGTTENNDRNTWYGYKTKYGYFEIRAKLADCGGGGHQAWWMVGMQEDTNNWFDSKQTGEIDILETFYSTPDAWRIAAYGWNDPNFQTSWYLSQDPVPSGSPTEEFHVYAMEWTPTRLNFYYDNQLFKTIYDSPDYDMGMILNIYTDAGSGVHNDVWPKEWAIDYVRVWKPENGYEEPAEESVMLKNRQTGKFAYVNPAQDGVQYGDLTPGIEEYAKWTREETEGYVRYKNGKTGEYMHIENLKGYVEHGSVPPTYWSAQWKETGVENYIRLTNRWQESVAVHTEDGLGVLQYGECPLTWWTSQWELVRL